MGYVITGRKGEIGVLRRSKGSPESAGIPSVAKATLLKVMMRRD